MKRCSTCKLDKSLSEFGKNVRMKDGLARSCRVCASEAGKRYYRTHKESHNAWMKEWRDKLKWSVAEYLVSYLKEHPCVDCGESDVLVLQFDHVDPSDKLFNVCNFAKENKSLAAVKAEVAKCEIRCANDHMRKTGHSVNSWRVQLSSNDQE